MEMRQRVARVLAMLAELDRRLSSQKGVCTQETKKAIS